MRAESLRRESLRLDRGKEKDDRIARLPFVLRGIRKRILHTRYILYENMCHVESRVTVYSYYTTLCQKKMIRLKLKLRYGIVRFVSKY